MFNKPVSKFMKYVHKHIKQQVVRTCHFNLKLKYTIKLYQKLCTSIQ